MKYTCPICGDCIDDKGICDPVDRTFELLVIEHTEDKHGMWNISVLDLGNTKRDDWDAYIIRKAMDWALGGPAPLSVARRSLGLALRGIR